MRGSLLTLILICTFASALTPDSQNSSSQLGKNSMKEVIASMTTEEKAKLLVGMGIFLSLIHI